MGQCGWRSAAERASRAAERKSGGSRRVFALARFKSNTARSATSDCFCFCFCSEGDNCFEGASPGDALTVRRVASVGDADALDALLLPGWVRSLPRTARVSRAARASSHVATARSTSPSRSAAFASSLSATTGSPGSSIAGESAGGGAEANASRHPASIARTSSSSSEGGPSGFGRPSTRDARAVSRAFAAFAPPRAASTVARASARGGVGGATRASFALARGLGGASTPPGARAQPPRASAPPRSRGPTFRAQRAGGAVHRGRHRGGAAGGGWARARL